MNSEWTDWRDHDGTGCPQECIGQMVHIIGLHFEVIKIPSAGPGWWRENYGMILPNGKKCDVVVRYRIRRYPDAVEPLLQAVKEPEDA